MGENLLEKETLEEVKIFLTYKNPNNFDEYVGRVWLKNDFNYTWVTKNSLLNSKKLQEENINKKSNRKQHNPKRIDWVDFHSKEISHFNPYIDLENLSPILKKKIDGLKKKHIIESSYLLSIDEKIVSKEKNLISDLPIRKHKIIEESNSKINLENKHLLRKSTPNQTFEKKNKYNDFPLQNDESSEENNNVDTGEDYFPINDENVNFLEQKNFKFLQNSQTKNFAKKESNMIIGKNSEIQSETAINLEGLYNKNENYHQYLNEPSSSECIVCNWTYPKEMNPKEKNVHVNLCLEGKGEDHKEIYIKSLRVVNLALKNEDNTISSVLQEQLDSCPLCGKIFKGKSRKVKENHITDCLREKEENELYKDKKRKTTRFNYSNN